MLIRQGKTYWKKLEMALFCFSYDFTLRFGLFPVHTVRFLVVQVFHVNHLIMGYGTAVLKRVC